jgi:hypothetical protein
MGQTLTHGVYLPDEGERNCYNGLAGNWSILDGAVGTIAEHTSALSDKAPLVHTHSKSDITDFPAYGTTAGTICEGNDARLSDARTPVAHTHTKSDVTDLLNSNFIPSANNSYDLGSSSQQWNNVYSKGYYYNGVAWGLDKENVWSGINIFTDVIAYKDTVAEIGNYPASNRIKYQTFVDKNGTTLGYTDFAVATSGVTRWDLWLENKATNGALSPTGTQVKSFMSLYIDTDMSSKLRLYGDFIPNNNNRFNLGDSTNKWKSFNGINPGALSLPDIYDSYNVVTTNWSTAYNQPNDLKINGANPTYPGWLFIRLDNCTQEDDFLIVRYYHVNAGNLTFFGSFIPTASSYVLCVPIQAGITTKVWVSKIPTTCKYYACLGTVK